jgi:hypothetical protein
MNRLGIFVISLSALMATSCNLPVTSSGESGSSTGTSTATSTSTTTTTATHSGSSTSTTTAIAGNCPMGNAYADGCAAAVSGSAQHPTLFADYHEAARPPWNVAGVEFAVGVPSSHALRDPTVQANLPSGASVDTVNHLIRVTSNNVTLDSFDFSLHGGYSVYVTGASGTRVTNSYFFGLQPAVHDDANSSNTYVGYNTIDGGGGTASLQCNFGETLPLGPNATVEYNWIKNVGQHFVSSGGGALVYRYNLLEDGGWCPGAHLNFLQWGNAVNATAQVNFNTAIQHVLPAGGEGFQVEGQLYAPGVLGSITNCSVSYNTIISNGTKVAANSGTQAMSYIMHLGNSPNGPANTQGTFTGVANYNYFDSSSAYGPIYPGLVGFTYTGNWDMVHNTPVSGP